MAGDRGRRWCLGALFALLVLGVVLSTARGAYVVDNRFEWYWSPGRLLARVPSLWDGTRGIGRPRGEFSLVPWSVLAALRGLGAGPAVAERLWHAGLLLSAGLGTVAFLRCFRPRVGTEHVVAGLFAMFSPYTAVFLIPSGLFLNYALAPWLLVAFVRGAREERPWRWAAVFALLVLASGSTDPPGLFYSLLLLVPTALWLGVVPPATRWRRIASWLGRAALLSAVASAAALAQVLYGLAGLSTRLFLTESVAAVQRTASWAESWRGLGFWASYFAEGQQLLRPEHAAYFRSAPVVLATFVPACAAVAAFGWCRWRPRFLMVALVLVSLTLMVASFPPGDPPPLGRLLLEAYEDVPSLAALRTSYKAGAGLVIGVGCLFGVGVAAASRAVARRRRRLAAVPLAGALVVVAVVSFPFWTGEVYGPEGRMRAVPGYWREALAWLDRQPGDSRVLVVPGTSNTVYRWGNPGDDLFDALLARPHVMDTALPLSTAQAADLVSAVDDRVQSGRYRPGTLAPVVRRLGIEFVVVRNDVDWQRLRRARPSALRALRDDPDLVWAAEFGRRGQNVVRRGDRSPEARREAELPPVEVYRVRGVTGTARAVPLQPPLLVSGDGHAWFHLAARGLLAGTAPLRYTAATSDAALAEALRQGAPVLVTDTNRRREVVVTRFGDTASHTLSPHETLSGRVGDLFGEAGSHTVAAFTDAETIGATSTGGSLTGFEPWFRPANAFDGDESTWWLTEGIQEPAGRSVWVELDGPREVSTVAIVAGTPPGSGRSVALATVRFSDGSSVLVDTSEGRAEVRFPPRVTTSLEVRIDAVAGAGGGSTGLSEISVPSLDLTEVLQVPDDVFRAADRHPSLRRALAGVPVTYLFERVREGGRDLETSVRRRFRTLGRRSYAVEGTLTPAPGTLTPAPGTLTPAGAARGSLAGCVEGVVAVDGTPVPVRLGAPMSDGAEPVSVPFTACVPVALGGGWHRLETGPLGAVDDVTLSTGGGTEGGTGGGGVADAAGGGAGVEPRVEVLSAEGSRLRLRVHAPDRGVVVVSGQSYDPRWEAAAGGRDLGRPQPLDTQSAWVVREAGTHLVNLRYGPQRTYRVALALTAAGAAVCLALALPARRRRRP